MHVCDYHDYVNWTTLCSMLNETDRLVTWSDHLQIVLKKISETKGEWGMGNRPCHVPFATRRFGASSSGYLRGARYFDFGPPCPPNLGPQTSRWFFPPSCQDAPKASARMLASGISGPNGTVSLQGFAPKRRWALAHGIYR